MLKRSSPANTGNNDYQHRLAQELVQSMGHTEAAAFCSQNDWQGTLRVILHHSHSPTPQ